MTGSLVASRSASSNRRDSASPRVFLLVDRLLEDRFPPRGLLSENPLRVAQLRLVRTFRLIVSDDSLEIDIDDQPARGSTDRRRRVPI